MRSLLWSGEALPEHQTILTHIMSGYSFQFRQVSDGLLLRSIWACNQPLSQFARSSVYVQVPLSIIEPYWIIGGRCSWNKCKRKIKAIFLSYSEYIFIYRIGWDGTESPSWFYAYDLTEQGVREVTNFGMVSNWPRYRVCEWSIHIWIRELPTNTKYG